MSVSTASTRPAARGGWPLVVIGVVGLLAIGIGLTLGSFLVTDRAAGASTGSRYVPADAPFYLDWHVEPSTTQDAAIRELLGRFPAIEGIDLSEPLYPQLATKLDEEMASNADAGAVELRWSEDVDVWFDGTVAVAITSAPAELFAPSADPMAPPPMPDAIVILGSDDPEAARAAISRLAGDAELTQSTHAGATVYESDGDDAGAWAITDDAVLVAPDVADVRAALDLAAGGAGGMAGAEVDELLARLPEDRLGFVLYDMGPFLQASIEAAEAQDPAAAEAMRALMEGQPTRGAIAISAAGDRIAFDGASIAPTGAYSVENAERGLAARVPGDALYFADAGNLGTALEGVLLSVKQAAASDEAAGEGIATAEAALGAELEELVRWIGDGAIVAGWDGTTPYAGLLLVPTDRDAAERRLDQLTTFAGLAATDPGSGITIEEGEVAGVTVTTIRWADPNAAPIDPALPVPAVEVIVQTAITGEHVLIGVGDAFVPRILELDPADALAANPRYADSVAELGDASNTGTLWWDVTGTREAIESAIEPMRPFLDPDGAYENAIEPWLVPFDRIVAVSVLDDGVLVQRGAIFVE